MTMNRTAKLALVALAAAAVIAGALFLFATRWTPSRDNYAVQGIDISQNNGDVDWALAKAAGVEFAYVRASGGAADRDDHFARNWEETRQAGIRRGAHHDFSLCQLASDQAANFITTVPREKGALPPAIRLAFEESCTAHPARAVLVGEIDKFIRLVEAHAEQPVVLSIDSAFETEYQISGAIDRPLWLRRNFFPPDFGARAWVMWNASTYKHVDGIRGTVNWSVVRQ
jgi:lysozyme